MFRSKLAGSLLLLFLFLATQHVVRAQVAGETATTQVQDEDQDEDEPSETSGTQEEREKERIWRLDLAIPEHDEATRTKDEETGVVWSWLRKGPEDRELLRTGDRVLCHYTLWTRADGTEIESTRRRDGRSPSPVPLEPGATIRGLNVVMAKMRPGDKVRIDVPAAMGFGKKGLRNRIAPDTDLVYALQALRVESHVDIPEMPVWKDEAATKLEDGSAYMIVKDGEGAIAGDKSAIAFDYILRDDSGNIIDSSLIAEKSPVGGQVGMMGLPYQNKIGLIARRGGEYLVRVPTKLLFRSEAPAHVDIDSKYLYFYFIVKDLVPFKHPADAKMVKDKNGLEYVILKPGIDDKTKPEDRVHIHYAHWTLEDGRLFDSSYTRGISNNFSQKGLVAGMCQALTKIGPGGEIRVRVPAALAWGEAGRIGVGANQDILMHIELFPETLPSREPRRLLEPERFERWLHKRAKEAEKAAKKKAKKDAGKDGEDGEDGEDGQDGADGQGK